MTLPVAFFWGFSNRSLPNLGGFLIFCNSFHRNTSESSKHIQALDIASWCLSCSSGFDLLLILGDFLMSC